MSEGKQKFKPHFGVIFGALSLVLISLFTLGYLSFVALRKVTDSDNDTAMFRFGDFVPVIYDSRKLQSVGRAEYELWVATMAQGSGEYPKFHSSVERAESELDFALGEKTQSVSMLRLYHAMIEADFRKWSVVESLARSVLKNMPDSSPRREVRFDSKRVLAEALEEQGKYEEALQIRLEFLAEVQKENPDSSGDKLLFTMDQLANLYEVFHEYDKAYDVVEQMIAIYALNKKSLVSRWMIFDLELRQAALKASAHRLTESLSIFDRVITANPLPLAYACRGHVFERDFCDYSKAISDYTQAIQIEEAGRRSDGSHRMNCFTAGACASEYYLYRAISYMHNEELVKALADANSSIRLSSGRQSIQRIRIMEIVRLLLLTRGGLRFSAVWVNWSLHWSISRSL
jgi:tetratricopeptide (TPR) repeat protein